MDKETQEDFNLPGSGPIISFLAATSSIYTLRISNEGGESVDAHLINRAGVAQLDRAAVF